MAAGGPERWVLAMALLVPLGIAGLSVARFQGPFDPSRVLAGGDQPSTTSLVHRPAPSELAPPPTLEPPTPTPPPPAATPTPGPTPTPQGQATYVVQPGDELKSIAANYGVSIQSILAANDVPNPDSLRVGQALTIPPPKP